MSHFPTKILLATDGSEDAALALRAAVDLSTRTGSELHVVHAWQVSPPYSHPGIASATDSGLYEQEVQKVLLEQLDGIEAAGGTAAGTHLERGRPAEAITALSEKLGAGLVVMGSRGLGPVQRLVMGSVSEDVVAGASCPVLVARGGCAAWPPSRVVVGEDSSPGARKAGELAAGIGSLFGSRAILVRAYPLLLDVSEAARIAGCAPVALDEALRQHRAALEERARKLEGALGRRPLVRVCEGEAAATILEAAEEGGEPTLIAVGRRGLGLVDRLRLGSVSTKVLRAATGPVLISPS
jgi:nucleotide-binding universal stress UspA family protein